MFEIDPARLELAREFRDRPFGIHSPDLQAVLSVMRRGPIKGKYVLFMTEPQAEWVLARMAGDPLRPELIPDQVFHSLEDAEWEVFKRRWQAITGARLEIN